MREADEIYFIKLLDRRWWDSCSSAVLEKVNAKCHRKRLERGEELRISVKGCLLKRYPTCKIVNWRYAFTYVKTSTWKQLHLVPSALYIKKMLDQRFSGVINLYLM